MPTLQVFLDSKPLYYDVIDYDRMPRTYAAIKDSLHMPQIIHVVGTNGKGTTGRFLAHALYRKGFNTGHYTSPHILKFNERIWLNGSDVEDDVLETAHQKLYAMLGQAAADALSYFEYTTLLAALIYDSCDYVVMEAGLGGEHDATNVFAKRLSIFTPVGMDHEAFLGNDLASIATTKFRSMETTALIATQPHAEIYDYFDQVAAQKGTQAYRTEELISCPILSLIDQTSQYLQLPDYLKKNLSTAMAALKLLGIESEVGDFEGARLFGRMSRIAPNVWLDVGHNALAAAAIARVLKGKQVVLVYNTYKDKGYREILTLLQPVVRRVELMPIEGERAESNEKLQAVLEELGLPYRRFESVNEDEEYLVFGSFSVAEAFLKGWNE